MPCRLLLPAADQAHDVVKLAGSVFITPLVQALEIERQPEQMAQLFDAEIGGGERFLPVPVVDGLDQALQHIERGGDDAIAERELGGAWEPFHHRRAPLQEGMHRLDGGANAAGGVTHAGRPVEAAGRGEYVPCMEIFTPDAIARLSPEERFDLIDRLWDSLGEKDWALTPVQTEELARRLETFDADRAEGVAWEVLRDDLLSKT